MADDRDDPLLFSFFNEIGIIDQLARSQLERVLPGDMKVSHFSVLNHFARRGGRESPGQLAIAFQVTKGAITNTITKLEAQGLVDIEPDPDDGRGKLVSLTDKGLALRNEAVEALAPVLADLAAEFPERDFADALPFLTRLRKFLDAYRDPR